MIVATLAVLAGGVALQLAFYGHGGHAAISDLPRVFVHRGFGRGSLPYVDRVLEYPVAAGVMLYLAAMIWPTPLGVLLVTAVASVVVCVAIAIVLERRFGSRAWRWAIGVPVFLYAFQNWDVFAIAALLVGLFAFDRGYDRAAGAAFGLGAAIKLFPAVVVPPLVAVLLVRGDKRGAFRLAASSTATFLALNLPFVVANPSGWWWPFTFQGKRNATWGSAWFYALRVVGLPVHGQSGARVADLVSFVTLAAALGWLVFVTMRRQLSPFSVAVAAVAIFILCNKVYSPTYDVWLVAFFVLLPLSRRLWVTFCMVDAAVYVTVYGYFHGVDSAGFVHLALPILVAIRTVVLLVLVRDATRRPAEERSGRSSPAPTSSCAEVRATGTKRPGRIVAALWRPRALWCSQGARPNGARSKRFGARWVGQTAGHGSDRKSIQ